MAPSSTSSTVAGKMRSSASSRKKVCVIGGGLAGLASARELRREGHEVTVIEQRHGVGGLWLYDDGGGSGGDHLLGMPGVQSSIYASLRLNTPRESMGFSDFPFRPKSGAGGDARRFPGHREFLRYIRDFCDAFGLMDAVRLNTTVLRVAMADDDDRSRWAVRSARRDDDDDEVVTEEVFDAVVVATGRCCKPRLPAIAGMEEWRRRQLHCRTYRVPEPFRGEVVVLVGCRVSGKEIALELTGGNIAKEVHLSVRSTEEAMTPAMSKMLANHADLHLHPQIERLHDDGRVAFADGSCVVADTIIYCTGYNYSFPFLDTGGAVTVDDNRVGPLYEHVFPPSLAPSLSFVGVPTGVILPLFFEVQARWVAQVLSGRRTLPPEEEMLRSVEEYNRGRELAGVPKRRTHALCDLEYCNAYGEKHCGFPRVEEWKALLWSSVVDYMRDNDAETFRDGFRDGELVVEGLRLHGWLPPAPPEEEEVQMQSMGSATTAAAAAPTLSSLNWTELK